jgi:hypothetical protein
MKKDKKKMWYVEIMDQHSGYVTREADHNDEWDADDISYTHSVMGIRTVEEGYSDVTVPFEVVEGKEYYLVYVTYSTGDSFHHEEGCVRYIDLFESFDKANALAKAIETHYSFSDNEQRWADKKVKPPKGYKEWTLSYKNEADQEIETHVSWAGYFERMSNVTVERVRKSAPKGSGKILYR